MADMVLATKEDRENTNSSRRLVDIEPVDGAVDRQVSHASENVVAGRAANRKRRKLICCLSDAHDATRGAIKGVP